MITDTVAPSAFVPTVAGLNEVRATDPGRIRRLLATRQRRSPFGPDGKLMIIACDHPARGALGAGGNAYAMASRTDLLDRLVTALAHPGVDGLLATADIVEDLLLLGALEHKVVFASMNRGGLQGSVFEMDDRLTGYDVAGVLESGLDGGKMLVRINLDDPGTVATLELTGRAVSELNRAERIAMVEPFVSLRRDGKIVNDLVAGRRDPVGAHRAGPRRLQRVHLAQAAGGSRDGTGDGRDHAAHAAARRRPGGGARGDVRGLAGRPRPPVGPRPGGRPHDALPGR